MNAPTTTVEPKTIPVEFTERVCNLLLICIDGVKTQIPENSPLLGKLDSLSQVVKKAISLQKTSDLGKDIQELFREKSVAGNFQELERAETKHIILAMAQVIQEVVQGIGSYGNNLEGCIQKLEATDDLNEILAIKNQIIDETKKTIAQSKNLHQELESSRKTAQDLSKRLEQTQTKALIDPLTKALNRAAYNMKLRSVIRERETLAEKTALLILDIDHFKEFNDQHGHQVGDRVLRSVAGTIQESLRASDLVFRYGGEEFVVFLFDTDPDQADVVADRIRRQVKKDYLVDKQGRKLTVTVSLGLTVLQSEDTLESLFERADKALYKAKEGGRDRVETIE